MKVEIFSDVACPFCYIGMANFEDALASFPDRDEVEVTWRSFQLNPEMPALVEGDIYDYLASKFGVSRDEARGMNDRVLASAHGAGLDMNFDAVRPANTFDAHRLLHLAEEVGRADEMARVLFDGYFNAGADLADPDDLLSLAVRAGLGTDEAAEVIRGDRFASEVEADRELSASMGISAVPTFVIDRKLGVQGAQPPEVLLGALTQG
ncbi:MAG: DsbA family oxidoreductase, partial [Actinomycetota bacterium]|nr:DsbA family oxidoreductase [Actinomycetota bacterium]